MKHVWSALVALVACGGSAQSDEPDVMSPAPSMDPIDAPGGVDEVAELAGVIAEETASGWLVTRVPVGRADGAELAMMVDAMGQPHVAYSVYSESSGPALHHAWLEGNELKSEVVDASTDGYHKSWVAKSPEPRLIYDDSGYWHAPTVYHSQRREWGWEVESFAFEELSGASAALWQDGRLVLGRSTFLSQYEVPVVQLGVNVDGQALPLEYMRLAKENAPPLLGLAVDHAGVTHVVYATQLEQVDGVWIHEDVASAREGVRLASSYPPPTVIRHATLRQGAWTAPEDITTTATFNEGLSLVIDANDDLHVVFTHEDLGVDPRSGELVSTSTVNHYVRDAAAGWSREEVFPGNGAVRVANGSLAIDAAGDLHLAYCTLGGPHSQCDGVGYALRSSGGWHGDLIQEDACDRFGGGAALALGGDGSVYVAYAGCDGELRLARQPRSPR